MITKTVQINLQSQAKHFSVSETAARDVVAIGGVNQSPFSEDVKCGRLQRFYVLNDARRQGVGSLLLKEITDHSRGKFNEMTVRTESSKADAFYRSNGFNLDDSASETTHVLKL